CGVKVRRDCIFVGATHRTRVKSRDLVVVQVCGDERLGSKRFGDLAHAVQPDTEALEPLEIKQRIVAYRPHHQRILAEELQVVGDVAGATAELASQLGNEEGNVQDVDLLRQNVFPEVSGKHHDVVVGDRTADQSAHERGVGSGKR